MDFDELYKSIKPTKESILEAVDEYTLYCFYTGIDDLALGRVYPCPYRTDPIPSFSVFKVTIDLGVEYWWKDHGKDEKGNIFKLIQKIEKLDTLQQVFQRINDDFGLGYNLPGLQKREKISLFNKPTETIIKIRVANVPLTEAGFNYWKQFEVDRQLLDFYNTTQISWYWSYDEQQAPFSVHDPTFAYRTGAYYQIYSPFAPKIYKFRNDLPENYFFGYLQLSKSGEKLIIDKSCKDVIFCRRLGYEAVCGKSETTMIPEKKMLEFKERFKEVFIMLDNDAAGIRQTEKYLSLYPWLKPRFLTGAKDKTDYAKAFGVQAAQEAVDNLLK